MVAGQVCMAICVSIFVILALISVQVLSPASEVARARARQQGHFVLRIHVELCFSRLLWLIVIVFMAPTARGQSSTATLAPACLPTSYSRKSTWRGASGAPLGGLSSSAKFLIHLHAGRRDEAQVHERCCFLAGGADERAPDPTLSIA